MMSSSILDLEQRDIELQLQEIQLKRRMVEIEREKLEEDEMKSDVEDDSPRGMEAVKVALENVDNVVPRILDANLHLHYSKSTKETLMTIKGVTSEGCILVKGKNNSEMISKKYNIRSLKWIQGNLARWSKQQKLHPHFWTNIAARYSRKFLEGDSISRTTIEKLCYLVDSGIMNPWFEEYDHLKGYGAQSQLMI